MPHICRSFIVGLLVPMAIFAMAQTEDEDSLDRDYSAELPRIPPLETDEARATFRVLDGFQMDLVAAEPLIYDPIAMAFDERGRLFVVEMRGYSERRDERIGSVRLLEDTDGDGRFDKSTRYADGLAWPTAVACYDGGVFVGVPPDILYFKDEDGDGEADRKEQVYTGFGLSNVQGLLNTFKWGLDNRIHGATSGTGGNILRVGSTARAIPVSGRDFAFDPRTLDFSATSGGGQHGLTFDLAGRKFVCHNSDHIMQILYDNDAVARNPFLAPPRARVSIAVDGPQADVFRISPVEPWRIVRTRLRLKGIVGGPIEGNGTASGYFTSATGITVYKGDAWPAEYRGQVFVADVGSNLIHRKRLVGDGLVLQAERMDAAKEFVASTDIWFRPVQFCNAPDGTLFIADMYREVIEHPDSLPPLIKQHLDLNSGFDRGRIYRVVPDGFTQPAIPNLGAASTAELVALLAHPNAWHHETAARLLYERQDRSATPALEALARDAEAPHGRMRALYALDGLGVLEAQHVFAALSDSHPDVRIHALRFAERFFAEDAIAGKALSMVGTPELRVRYQLAFSLGAMAHSEARADALAELIRNDGAEAWMRLAVQSSLAVGAASVLERLAGEEFLLDSGSGFHEFAEGLAYAVGASGRAEDVLRVLDAAEGGADPAGPFAQLLVRGLVQGLRNAPRDSGAHTVMAEAEIARAVIDGMVAQALRRAADPAVAQQRRVEEIRTLGLAAFDSAAPVLVELLDPSQPRDVQLAALQTLAYFDDPSVADAILAAWTHFSPNLRAEAIEILFSNEAWLRTLLDAIEEADFARSNIDSNRIQFLHDHAHADIRERAGRLFTARSPERIEAVIEEYLPALHMPGSPEAGRSIFEERCAQCHQFQGIGFEVGPNMATVAHRGPETILVNILDPHREIHPQYVNYVVDTKGWDTLTGILDSETATSITLRRAGGLEDTVLRVNIDSMRSTDLSIMPEGLEVDLGLQGMADLLSFLLSEPE